MPKNIATNFYLKSKKYGSNNKVDLCWRTVDQIQKPARKKIIVKKNILPLHNLLCIYLVKYVRFQEEYFT